MLVTKMDTIKTTKQSNSESESFWIGCKYISSVRSMFISQFGVCVWGVAGGGENVFQSEFKQYLKKKKKEA